MRSPSGGFLIRVAACEVCPDLGELPYGAGRSQVQQGFDDPRVLLGDRLREGSLYRLLADHGHQMFPDGYLADLYTGSVKGRPTVAARVVATVMLLQAFEGLSDREAMTGLRWTCAGRPRLGWTPGAGRFTPLCWLACAISGSSKLTGIVLSSGYQACLPGGGIG